MSTSIDNLIEAIDTLGRPFVSTEIAVSSDATKRNNISSLLCHLYNHGVIRRVGMAGKSHIYDILEGKTARQAYKETGVLRRGARTSSKRPENPAFLLGDLW